MRSYKIQVNPQKTAADRIDQLYWVGILEESTRSMELLSHQLGYNKRIVLPRARTHTETHASTAKPSERNRFFRKYTGCNSIAQNCISKSKDSISY